MTQAYTQLLQHVHLVRQSWRSRRVMEGVVITLGTFAAALTVAAVLDQLLRLGITGRVVLALVLWGGTFWAAWRWLVRPVAARHQDDFYAALAEQRQPALRNRLINALQLGRLEQVAAPALVAAIVNDGAVAAEELDLRKAASTPLLKKAGLGLGVVVLAAVAYLLLSAAATTCMARILLPGADILPFTWAQVTVTPDKPTTIIEGTPLAITAKVDARPGYALPGQATLHWTDTSGRLRAALMQADPHDAATFTYAFPALDAGMTFYATAGDGQSRDVTITMEPRPRISSMSVTYHYPAYTYLHDRKVDDFDGHLHGLPQTHATLTIHATKPLRELAMIVEGIVGTPEVAAGGASGSAVPLTSSVTTHASASDPATWTAELTLTRNALYHLKLADTAGITVDDPTRYTITMEIDAPPIVGFARPGRDIQVRPGDTIEFALVAQDDLGIGPVRLMGRVNNAKAGSLIQEWLNPERPPQRRLDLTVKKTIDELGLKAGDRLEYWATVEDLNDVSSAGPGRGESRHFSILVLTPTQAQVMMERQLSEYAKVLTELIRLQRLNRTETAANPPAQPLIDRQGHIRTTTQQLADLMQHNAFPAQTIIDQLRSLASDPMAKVVTLLESFRDATNIDTGKALAAQSLPVQDQIIQALEDILKRIDRDQVVRQDLKKIERTDQAGHKAVTATLTQLSKDLDRFLIDQRNLDERYEKMRKESNDDAKGEDLKGLNEALHQLDKWDKWAKDSVDGIAKLPEGFVKDAALAQNLNSIFEEIEKQAKGATQNIDTPLEEGAKMTGTKVLEDLEVWMPHHGDDTKWTMEEPMEGKFDIPPYTLPANLQDVIGDLIEDVQDFDEKADDVTSSWGGNLPQAGWDIADGPISTFSATGKTGNQLPNAQEITGRSGEGRRGRSSGQMVGDTAKGLEGRPTPARLTKEPYEKGNVKSDSQLDPHGATGGGKKTGGGIRGLQGGTPPDFVKDMDRLKEQQKMLREKTQELARQLDNAGRPSTHVDRALQLLDTAQLDMTDKRYEDAAKHRKLAISELKAQQDGVDQAVSLSLDKAPNLPPELRQQITAGSQQALPEGYEDLVGAYYKALSGAASGQTPTPASGSEAK